MIFGYRGNSAWRDTQLERELAGVTGDSTNGCFRIPVPPRLELRVIASNGLGWEHVSVSVGKRGGKLLTRVPTWEEMSYVKSLFWHEEAWVVQFHPAQSQYVDYGPILHLWRPAARELPTPPRILV